MNLLKICGSQFRLWLFAFWPIALKQLNSLTTIDTFSCLGGPVVTRPTGVQKVPGLIPDFGNDFLFNFLLCCCVFTFLSKTHHLSRFFCNFFCSVYSVSILTILQNVWLIKRVSRYSPRITKCRVHTRQLTNFRTLFALTSNV